MQIDILLVIEFGSTTRKYPSPSQLQYVYNEWQTMRKKGRKEAERNRTNMCILRNKESVCAVKICAVQSRG